MLIVYSLPTCGKCSMIKGKLTKKNISFEVCEDIEKMQSLGIQGIPCLGLDNGEIIRDFTKVNSYVNNL